MSASATGKIFSKEHCKNISLAKQDWLPSKEHLEKFLVARPKRHSEETKKKIGDKHKGKIVSEETRAKQRLYRHSEETKLLISIARTGLTATEETKMKMSISQTGRVQSEETKKRISESNKGKMMTEKTRQAVIASNIRRGKNNPNNLPN